MLATITGFPTAIWTVLLGVVLLYWFAAMLGMVDDSHFHPHAEAHSDGHGLGDLAGKLMALGLGGVPFSIVVSVYVLFGWLFSALAHQYLLWLPSLMHYLIGALILLLSGALALPCTAWLLRPLRGLFVTHGATHKASLIGLACKITTLHVDEGFGRAEIAANGAPLNIRVCAATPNALQKGSLAVTLDYDAAKDIYTVAAISEVDL